MDAMYISFQSLGDWNEINADSMEHHLHWQGKLHSWLLVSKDRSHFCGQWYCSSGGPQEELFIIHSCWGAGWCTWCACATASSEEVYTWKAIKAPLSSPQEAKVWLTARLILQTIRSVHLCSKCSLINHPCHSQVSRIDATATHNSWE